MSDQNNRRYPRYKTEFEATISTTDINLPVNVVDIGEKGIGIISETPIELKTEVNISLFLMGEESLKGTPVWSMQLEKDQKYYYRIGIETIDLVLERMKARGFPAGPRLES